VLALAPRAFETEPSVRVLCPQVDPSLAFPLPLFFSDSFSRKPSFQPLLGFSHHITKSFGSSRSYPSKVFFFVFSFFQTFLPSRFFFSYPSRSLFFSKKSFSWLACFLRSAPFVQALRMSLFSDPYFPRFPFFFSLLFPFFSLFDLFPFPDRRSSFCIMLCSSLSVFQLVSPLRKTSDTCLCPCCVSFQRPFFPLFRSFLLSFHAPFFFT